MPLLAALLRRLRGSDPGPDQATDHTPPRPGGDKEEAGVADLTAGDGSTRRSLHRDR